MYHLGGSDRFQRWPSWFGGVWKLCDNQFLEAKPKWSIQRCFETYAPVLSVEHPAHGWFVVGFLHSLTKFPTADISLHIRFIFETVLFDCDIHFWLTRKSRVDVVMAGADLVLLVQCLLGFAFNICDQNCDCFVVSGTVIIANYHFSS